MQIIHWSLLGFFDETMQKDDCVVFNGEHDPGNAREQVGANFCLQFESKRIRIIASGIVKLGDFGCS